jgi:hypothetical protein
MTNETTPAQPYIDKATWLELQTREIDNFNKRLDAERKNRAKREFILVITCFVALLYTYPVHDFATNPTIEVPSISLKIPVRDAIAVFPTLIAAIYLVYLSSALGESIIMVRASRLEVELRTFKESGEIQEVSPGQFHFNVSRYLFLPSALHSRSFVFGAAALPKAIVDLFVGLIFTLLPYGTLVFILMRSWRLLHLKVLLTWNVVCLVIMVLAFTSALLSSRPQRNVRRW